MSDKSASLVEMASVKSHPDYSDGYHAAFQGGAFDTDRAGSEAYAYGFDAGERAVALFEKNGLKRSGRGMSISLTALASQETPNG